MATLTGTKIKDTYEGILKTLDNAAISGISKALTDGAGNLINMEVATGAIKFPSGTVDFTGATVSGLPVAEAGFVNGTGTNSLKQADALTTNAANASQNSAIAIGNGAAATGNESVAIGDFAESTNVGCLAIGQYAAATGLYASAWGRTASAASDGAVAFGQQSTVPFTVPGGVAMGRQVTADLADTTHVRALKIVAPDGGTGGNGITFLSPNGTAGLITLTDLSELAVNGTPIGGGGGAAGLVAGTGTDSIISADSLGTTPNIADVANTIAIGDALNNSGIGGGTIMLGKNWNQTYGRDGIFIGTNSNIQSVGQNDMIVIGNNDAINSFQSNGGIAIGNQSGIQGASNGYSIAIGYNAKAGINSTTDQCIALGYNSSVTASGGVALGAGVTAATVNTATVNLLQIAGYATMNFADDTAAATGGIPLGGVYHTSGALKIRIA